MDAKRKKEILTEWKERHPDMGVISIRCIPTGEQFLDVSKDTSTGYNRHRFQLSGNLHRNKHLQELWNQYGESEFEYSVVSSLKFDRGEDVKANDLEELLELCLMELPEAQKI